MKRLNFLAIALLLSTQLPALELKVAADNKTTNLPSRYAEKVTIIKLNETMQTVVTKTDVALPVVLGSLPAMEGAPYMVQVTHKGVNYNKVIPPNTPGESIDVRIEVYDTTNVFTPDLKMEKYIEVFYYPDILATDITQHVVNTGMFTFTERGSRNGILTYISPEGKNIEALATIETLHSSSDIKTLKLSPSALPDKPGYYLLDQPIKPGEKYYQTRAHYRYNGDALEITFANVYPMSTNPLLVLHSKNMTVKIKENPAWDTTPKFNENIGYDIVTLPNTLGKFTLVLSGGIPEKAQGGASGTSSNGQQGGQPILPDSPVNKFVRIGGLVAFMAILAGFFLYIKSRPVWLQMIQAKNKSRVEFELQHLKSLNLPPEVLAKKEQKLKEKLEALNKLSRL